MGQGKSKPLAPMRRWRNTPKIPSRADNRYWDSSQRKKKSKSKEKVIHYCIKIWGGKALINPHVLWPIFGSFEDWVCQQLSIWVNSKRPPASLEEREYTSSRTHLFPLRKKKKRELYLVLPWLLLYTVKFGTVCYVKDHTVQHYCNT